MNIDKIQPPVRDMIFDKFGKQYTLKRDKGSTISIYTNSKLDKSQFGNEMRLLEDQTYVSGYGIILQISKNKITLHVPHEPSIMGIVGLVEETDRGIIYYHKPVFKNITPYITIWLNSILIPYRNIVYSHIYDEVEGDTGRVACFWSQYNTPEYRRNMLSFIQVVDVKPMVCFNTATSEAINNWMNEIVDRLEYSVDEILFMKVLNEYYKTYLTDINECEKNFSTSENLIDYLRNLINIWRILQDINNMIYTVLVDDEHEEHKTHMAIISKLNDDYEKEMALCRTILNDFSNSNVILSLIKMHNLLEICNTEENNFPQNMHNIHKAVFYQSMDKDMLTLLNKYKYFHSNNGDISSIISYSDVCELDKLYTRYETFKENNKRDILELNSPEVEYSNISKPTLEEYVKILISSPIETTLNAIDNNYFKRGNKTINEIKQNIELFEMQNTNDINEKIMISICSYFDTLKNNLWGDEQDFFASFNQQVCDKINNSIMLLCTLSSLSQENNNKVRVIKLQENHNNYIEFSKIIENFKNYSNIEMRDDIKLSIIVEDWTLTKYSLLGWYMPCHSFYGSLNDQIIKINNEYEESKKRYIKDCNVFEKSLRQKSFNITLQDLYQQMDQNSKLLWSFINSYSRTYPCEQCKDFCNYVSYDDIESYMQILQNWSVYHSSYKNTASPITDDMEKLGKEIYNDVYDRYDHYYNDFVKYIYEIGEKTYKLKFKDSNNSSTSQNSRKRVSIAFNSNDLDISNASITHETHPVFIDAVTYLYHNLRNENELANSVPDWLVSDQSVYILIKRSQQGDNNFKRIIFNILWKTLNIRYILDKQLSLSEKHVKTLNILYKHNVMIYFDCQYESKEFILGYKMNYKDVTVYNNNNTQSLVKYNPNLEYINPISICVSISLYATNDINDLVKLYDIYPKGIPDSVNAIANDGIIHEIHSRDIRSEELTEVYTNILHSKLSSIEIQFQGNQVIESPLHISPKPKKPQSPPLKFPSPRILRSPKKNNTPKSISIDPISLKDEDDCKKIYELRFPFHIKRLMDMHDKNTLLRWFALNKIIVVDKRVKMSNHIDNDCGEKDYDDDNGEENYDNVADNFDIDDEDDSTSNNYCKFINSINALEKTSFRSTISLENNDQVYVSQKNKTISSKQILEDFYNCYVKLISGLNTNYNSNKTWCNVIVGEYCYEYMILNKHICLKCNFFMDDSSYTENVMFIDIYDNSYPSIEYLFKNHLKNNKCEECKNNSFVCKNERCESTSFKEYCKIKHGAYIILILKRHGKMRKIKVNCEFINVGYKYRLYAAITFNLDQYVLEYFSDAENIETALNGEYECLNTCVVVYSVVVTKLTYSKDELEYINKHNYNIYLNPDQLDVLNKLKIGRKTCCIRPDIGNKIRVGLLNAQSICNKVDNKAKSIHALIVDEKLHIMAITETWLSANDHKNTDIIKKLQPRKYSTVHVPRPGNKRGGGVLIVFDRKLKPIIENKDMIIYTTFEHIEIVFKITNYLTLRFNLIYKPTGVFSKDFADDMNLLINKKRTSHGKFLLLGDFNFHLDEIGKDMNAQKFSSFLNSHNLIQHVTQSTHNRGHILDLIITKNKELSINNISVNQSVKSDHKAILFDLPLVCKNQTFTQLEYRKYKQLTTNFQNKLTDKIDVLIRPNETITIKLLNMTIGKLLDEEIPTHVTKPIMFRSNCSWFTNEILQEKRKRRRLESLWRSDQTDKIKRKAYINQRVYVQKLIDEAKHQYYSNLTNFSKVLYSNTTLPPLFDYQNQKHMCDVFAQWFERKLDYIKKFNNKNVITIDDKHETEIVSINRKLTYFKIVSDVKLKKIIFSTSNKACIFNIIPPKVFKEYVNILLPALKVIITNSFNSGVYPNELKISSIVPVLKKRDADINNPKNYSLRLNSSFLSKCIDHIVSVNIVKHLAHNNLYDEFQSAYRKHYNKETALLRIQNDLLTGLDSCTKVILVKLDLSKYNYELININHLMKTLRYKYGILNKSLAWLESYVRNREYVININRKRSIPHKLRGLPRTRIGHIIFMLFLSHVSTIIKTYDLQYHLFSDKVFIYTSIDSNGITRVEKCIEDIQKWLIDNQMVLVTKSIEFTVFRIRKSGYQSLRIGDNIIQAKNKINLLGVWFDNLLHMNLYVNDIVRKSYSMLYKIRRIRKYITHVKAVKIVKRFVLSHIDYCNSLLYKIQYRHISNLQSVQNVCACVVNNIKIKRTNNDDMFKKLHWLNIEARVQYKILILAHKALYKKKPGYLQTLVSFYIAPYNFRNSKSFLSIGSTPPKKNIMDRSFFESAASLWNVMPQTIRDCENYNSFKSKLKTHILKHGPFIITKKI
uniref:ORF13 n=1 Tax=Malaco herpesvirus 2 TaxID=3031798 RepID=A0AA48SF06_9VIRU|nr:TPA_asm: ORF13 [Malaco herpesvirus 2]